MGGKALAGLCDIRPLHSYSTYVEVADQVNRTLTMSTHKDLRPLIRKVGNPFFRTPVLTNARLGHSDIDFIVSDEFMSQDPKMDQHIAEVLESKAHTRNGDVLSCEFKGFQIDFITAPQKTVQFNAMLNGHGGTGRFIVDLLRPYGLDVNRGGIYKRIEHDGEFVANVRRAYDYYQILQVSCLDQYDHRGSFMYSFKNIEDAYTFTYNSTLFTLRAFGLNEDLEYVGDGKRLEYAPFANFIKFIQTQQKSSSVKKPVYPTDDQLKFLHNRVTHTSSTGSKDFLKSVEVAIHLHLKDKALRKRFNGNIVTEITGLKPGPHLGKFMEAYRAGFESQDKFSYAMMASDPSTVAANIRAVYEDWIVKNPLPTSSDEVVEATPEVVEIKAETAKAIKTETPASPPPLTVKKRKVPDLVKVK